MRSLRRVLARALLAATVATGTVGVTGLSLLTTTEPAFACGTATDPCAPADPGGGSGDPGGESSPTVTEQTYVPPSAPTPSNPTAPTSPPMACSVYANGGGMGSYCVTLGASGVSQTLRERFGTQSLQRCRYSEPPAGYPVPFNANPGQGRYMLMSCLENIDFDTYDGGTDRGLSLSLVWVPAGTDTSDHHNGITDFLWDQVHEDAQLPVPVMRTRPNQTPIVGYPTYFTFEWLDPGTKQVVAQGPYAGKAMGGPFKQIHTNGLVMQAQATKITVDPNQKGIRSVTCDPSTPYVEGAAPADQPAGACSITFPRSSASARKYATEPIPANVDDAFNVSVTVDWKVTYGPSGRENQLGQGFTMRLHQVLPVQEVQTPNQPPTVIY